MKFLLARLIPATLGICALANLTATAASTTPGNNPTAWQQRLESDWRTAEYFRADTQTVSAVTTRDDAAGGCDGIKDGNYGFHTAKNKEPWWEVDLGHAQSIGRVVIWNRCQAPERAERLQVRLSEDGKTWRDVFQHTGAVFLGFTDKKPLGISLTNQTARFVRVQLPGENFLHLDEVEIFSSAASTSNLALRRPANQSSTSEWSSEHRAFVAPEWAKRTPEIWRNCQRLAEEWQRLGMDVTGELRELEQLRSAGVNPKSAMATETNAAPPDSFRQARALQRRLALRNPQIDFDALLFTKRVPPSFSHMSDQYYGWWSKPGGGIYLLRNFRGDAPVEECLTTQAAFREPGSFLRPTLSYDGKKILFAWCRHYPALADEKDKLNKANVPEDAFFHLFEMNVDGSNLRQLSRGKYDDFDGRYLPDGRIVFLSTRRGQAMQAGRESAHATMVRADLPDSYVRCGGGPERPVAVYTLHTMKADGTDLCAISPFEMFEWTPEIARDGSVMYSRWDYIDRDNMPYMGLWAISPDGANARLIYKNYTKAPHCTFEAKPIPGSDKIIFTASGHHAQTMGSLVLLDPAVSAEGHGAITRLTPEVPFPEIEGWPVTYYANPWPLSERFHLVAWGHEGSTVLGPEGWNRWHAVQRPANGMAVYLFDAASGARELLIADPQIACGDPIPVRARTRPPVIASTVEPAGPKEGRFLLADVSRGLKTVQRGEIKSLRIIAVPPKTHPTMNFPNLGITRDDPGKCVLGTVPVEVDGSAYFRVPAGVIVFFQALNERGVAVQNMRSVTHVQPGQTLSCAGCHEPRQQAPSSRTALAAAREPSKITPGPDGSWPFRFDRLVQPALDQQCVSCHSPQSKDAVAAKLDLTAPKSYETLVSYGKPSLQDQVWHGYRQGYSVETEGLAARSALLTLLRQPGGHHGATLDDEALERFVTWMDAYAQLTGAFDAAQEKDLEALRRASQDLLEARPIARQTEIKTARR